MSFCRFPVNCLPVFFLLELLVKDMSHTIAVSVQALPNTL